MNTKDISYIAGLFDGEGCFSLSRRSHSYGDGFQPQIQMAITNERIVAWLLKTIGFGHCYPKTRLTHGGLKVWTYLVTKHSDIKALLEILVPYLKIKKPQAKLLLEYATNHPPIRGWHCRLHETPEWEAKIFQQIKLLNSGMVLEIS